MTLGEFIAQTTLAAGTLSAIAWVLQKAITSQIDKQAEIALEHVRSSARIREIEHDVAFRRLDSRRAEVVDQCYQHLALVHRLACAATNIQNHVAGPERVEGLKKLAKAIAEFDSYLSQHRLYLPEAIADRAAEFADKIYFAGWHYHLSIEDAEQDKSAPYKGLDKAREVVRDEGGALLGELERQFRSLIGSERANTPLQADGHSGHH